MVVLCQNGEIYPYDDDQLVASAKSRGTVAKQLQDLEFTTLHKDGADGMDVIFPVDRFEDIVPIMKPRKKRQVSEKERQRLAEIGAKHRFTGGVQRSVALHSRVLST